MCCGIILLKQMISACLVSNVKLKSDGINFQSLVYRGVKYETKCVRVMCEE